MPADSDYSSHGQNDEQCSSVCTFLDYVAALWPDVHMESKPLFCKFHAIKNDFFYTLLYWQWDIQDIWLQSVMYDLEHSVIKSTCRNSIIISNRLGKSEEEKRIVLTLRAGLKNGNNMRGKMRMIDNSGNIRSFVMNVMQSKLNLERYKW